MFTPTKRQQDALQAIADHIARVGYPPTVRELTALLELSSPGSTYKLLTSLKRKGTLLSARRRARTMVPRKKTSKDRLTNDYYPSYDFLPASLIQP